MRYTVRTDGFNIHGSVVHTRNKETKLQDNPHYSNPDYSSGQMQTIFLAPQCKLEKDGGGYSWVREDGIEYNYSDRLLQWDYNKHSEAHKIAKEKTSDKTALYYEYYLSAYFGKPIEILHILAGVNVSNGYSYLVFGYKEKKG